MPRAPAAGAGGAQRPRPGGLLLLVLGEESGAANPAGDLQEVDLDLGGIDDHARNVCDRPRPREIHRLVLVLQRLQRFE
jgi:hypothetical protein